ncbi:DUF456 domain-containing protein [Sphingobacteriales bacterium CHB3]|nr:DUF456 domain-containing protein [Sphingobacteriales bacterium CHB3]
MSVFLWVVAVILVITGIVGVVVPVLPGTSLVFVGLLIAAWADGFVKVSWFTIGILGLLAVTSFGIDFYLASFGVKRFGASKLAMFGATAGMLVGMFFGIVGLLVGPFVGAFLGELVMRKDLKQAGKAGGGAWLGLAIGIAAKIALVFTMIGIFVLAYIF